jgi:hypothetical protein
LFLLFAFFLSSFPFCFCFSFFLSFFSSFLYFLYFLPLFSSFSFLLYHLSFLVMIFLWKVTFGLSLTVIGLVVNKERKASLSSVILIM